MLGEIVEITSEILMCRGEVPDNHYWHPEVANCYVVREGSTLFVIDTGTGEKMREALKEAVDRLKEGTKKLILINTHTDVAHFSNNDLIASLDAFEEFEHYVHELGEPAFDYEKHKMSLLKVQDEYFDVFEGPPALWRTITRFMGFGKRENALNRFMNLILKKYEPVNPSKETATFLKEEDEELIELGPITVQNLSMSGDVVAIDLGPLRVKGWKIDGAIVVQDGEPRSDHLMAYFHDKKLLVAGDLTSDLIPIRPGQSTGLTVQDRMKWCLEMVKEGLIEILVDAHHNDPVVGSDNILNFIKEIISRQKKFRRALFTVMPEDKGITLRDLYRELRKIRFEKPVVDYYIENQFPRSRVFLKSIIADILLEAGYKVRGSGKKAEFYLPGGVKTPVGRKTQELKK